ncbi:MAG: Cof-type HAD-IIB family hydrolase [Anaerolineae bacterium]|nr:Cof-type HAD-IIB family hydrolase [Anaerolineae bacterium]
MTDSIKLIVVDLDGTLLNDQHEMTERVQQALRAARDQGVKIMLATGKTRGSALKVIERLGLETPGIYVQGLVTYASDGSILHQITLDPAVARQVITFAEDRGFTLIAYSGTRMFVRARNHDTNLITEYGEPEPEVVGPLQNLLNDTTINKLGIVHRADTRRVKALRWQLDMQINGSARLVQPALDAMLEVLPKGGSKGAALKMLLKDLNIPASRVLAVGDGENDLEMVQMAGVGVAVSNAESILKASADYVTTAPYGDGVAEAIERYVLKPAAIEAEPGTSQPESTPDQTVKTEVENS